MNKQDLKIRLTEHEIDIYLALLQHGSLSAYDLAEKRVYRQHMIFFIALWKGICSFCQEGKTCLYSPLIRNSSRASS